MKPIYDTYTNHIEIDGQWAASDRPDGKPGVNYGIGDPFIMRFNGRYYMYPSTYDPCWGIKVFSSDDLVNWTYEGYAVDPSEDTSKGAYAPEVVYYRGYFFMCQSKGGSGHYIYRADNPLGPFVRISDNLGMGIDGAFHVTDDGRLYLMHTSTPAGLKVNEITATDAITQPSVSENTLTTEGVSVVRSIAQANLNHWIEGPGLIRRGDVSYLTYTGNHVISKGYRVAYSYAKDADGFDGFLQPRDNVTLMDAENPNHWGLGHSSNAFGPDLDSIWTAYHNYVGGGPSRRYNLDRYLSSGAVLTANGCTDYPVAMPARADFETRDASGLVQTADGVWSPEPTEDYFTAEFNLIPTPTQAVMFGYADGTGYRVSFTDSGLRLTRVSGGKEKLLGTGTAVYNANAINTVRIENGNGTGHVYLNGMRLITYEASACGGLIGYAQGNGVCYTAFSNDVFGSSDFDAIKNMPLTIPATTYLKGEGRGFSILNARTVKNGLRVGEKQSIKAVYDENAVVLKKDDWVRYAVNVPRDDTYLFALKVTPESMGAVVSVTVGEQTLVAEIGPSGNTLVPQKVLLGKLPLSQGVDTLTVKVVSGTLEFITVETYDNAQTQTFEGFEDFQTMSGSASVSDGALVVASSSDVPAVALWGASDANFTMTARLVMDFNEVSDCGIVFRASQYSYYSAQPTESFCGYYVDLAKQLVVLRRYDYGSEMLHASRMPEKLESGKEFSVTVSAQGNVFRVLINGEKCLESEDLMAHYEGRVGFYCTNATIRVIEFTYESLL